MTDRNLISLRLKTYSSFLYSHPKLICRLRILLSLILISSLRTVQIKEIALKLSFPLRLLCSLLNLFSKAPIAKMFVTTYAKRPSRWSKKEFLMKSWRKFAKNSKCRNRNSKLIWSKRKKTSLARKLCQLILIKKRIRARSLENSWNGF